MKRYLRALRIRLQKRHVIGSNVNVRGKLLYGQRSRVWAPREMTIGSNVKIGSDVRIEVDGQVGDGVLIANSAAIVGRRDHDMKAVGVPIRRADWVGMSPERLSLPVMIGCDVWIGFGAVVLSGVQVGDCAVIAAGAVVVSDVPPNTIVAGNPASSVSQRFSADDYELHRMALRNSGIWSPFDAPATS